MNSIFEYFCISHSFLNFSALPESKNLFITGFGHNQDSSSFDIGNVHHSMWKCPNLLIRLIDLSQVFLRTSEGFCCANIVDIAHSGRHCYWQENYFNMKLSCFTSQTLQNREGQLYLKVKFILLKFRITFNHNIYLKYFNCLSVLNYWLSHFLSRCNNHPTSYVIPRG